MRKLTTVLAAVTAIVFGAVEAEAKVMPRNLGGGLEVVDMVIPSFVVTGATDDTVGADGVVYHYDYSTELNFAITSSLAQRLPYPVKLYVDVQDDATDSSPVCDVTIKGKNQFGEAVSETISDVNEHTNKLSVLVYEEVTSFSGSCDGYQDADDDIRLVMSGYVGLPIEVPVAASVLSVTHANGSNSYTRYGGASDSAILFDNAGSGSRINLRRQWINLETTFGAGDDIGDLDSVVIKMVPTRSRERSR